MESQIVKGTIICVCAYFDKGYTRIIFEEGHKVEFAQIYEPEYFAVGDYNTLTIDDEGKIQKIEYTLQAY